MGRLLVGMGILAASGCGAMRSSYFVDSVDDDQAVLITENGESFSVDLGELPSGAREGDWVADGQIDEEVRVRRQARIEQKRQALMGPDDRQDFDLDTFEVLPGTKR